MAATNSPLNVSQALYNLNSYSITVVPTSAAKPDTEYAIVADNTIIKPTFYVSWTSLELAIQKQKSLSIPLSPDEVTAVKIHPAYSTKLYRVDHTHPIFWLIVPIATAFLILWALFLYPNTRRRHGRIGTIDFPYTSPDSALSGRSAVTHASANSSSHTIASDLQTERENIQSKTQKSPPNDTLSGHTSIASSKGQNSINTIVGGSAIEHDNTQNRLLLNEYIQDALVAIDKTTKRFNQEEDANRELVTFLKARGIETQYQFRLPNGRTVDAKAGDALIEGKLSPDTAEVDRLLGQLSDYAEYSSEVHVVVYGHLDNYSKNRILREIDSRYKNKVTLHYLSSPTRHRSH